MPYLVGITVASNWLMALVSHWFKDGKEEVIEFDEGDNAFAVVVTISLWVDDVWSLLNDLIGFFYPTL